MSYTRIFQKVSTFVIIWLLTADLTPLKADIIYEEYCHKINKDQVRYLFQQWNNALLTLNPQNVVDKYWIKSTLLPTLSNVPRLNTEGKLDYFQEFLKKKPIGNVVEGYFYTEDCNGAQYRSGILSLLHWF